MKATIDELYTFITIVEAGSIVEASLQLSQTTSAVSRSLKRLEQKLNVTLLERTTRRFQLTDAGTLFLQYAREIIDKLDEAEDRVLNIDKAISGTIRIDAATPFMLHILTPLIIQFTEQYPNIEIELNNHEHIIDLLKEKIDIAIRIGKLEDSTLRTRHLMQSQLHIIASPAYLAKHGTPQNIAELKTHVCIGFNQLSNLNQWPIDDGGKHYTITPRLSSTSGEIIRCLVLQNAGIACLSEFLVEKDLEEGRLVKLLTEQTELSIQNIYAVFYKRQYLPKRIRLLIDFLYTKLNR